MYIDQPSNCVKTVCTFNNKLRHFFSQFIVHQLFVKLIVRRWRHISAVYVRTRTTSIDDVTSAIYSKQQAEFIARFGRKKPKNWYTYVFQKQQPFNFAHEDGGLLTVFVWTPRGHCLTRQDSPFCVHVYCMQASLRRRLDRLRLKPLTYG